jgi:hypothetical protein
MHDHALPIGLFLAVDAVLKPNPGEWWASLLQLGVAGVMLSWFMLRMERRMDRQAESNVRLAKAIERSTKAHMVTVAALKSLERLGLRDLAHGLIEEIDAAEQSGNEDSNR